MLTHQLEACCALPHLIFKIPKIGIGIISGFQSHGQRLREVIYPSPPQPPPNTYIHTILEGDRAGFRMQFPPLLDPNPAFHQPPDFRTDFLNHFPLKRLHDILAKNKDSG